MATIQGEDSKTKYAFLFLDDLIKGIDPITKQNADKETIERKQVKNCFIYLREKISQRAEKENKPKFGAEAYSDIPLTATELCTLISNNGVQFTGQPYAISNWMLQNGYLCISENKEGKKIRIPTGQGKKIGLISKTVIKKGGQSVHLVLYGKSAQKLVAENFAKITEM